MNRDPQLETVQTVQIETPETYQVKESNSEDISKREPEVVDISPRAKYMRVDNQNGTMIFGFYTPANMEKLEGFTPVYINIGDPSCVKELVGVRKNSQFMATGKNKNKNNDVNTQSSYLVVSFENRKKNNSPWVEFPISRLGILIKGLEELKDRMCTLGYYSDPQILKVSYPENTVVSSKDCKDSKISPSFN